MPRFTVYRQAGGKRKPKPACFVLFSFIINNNNSIRRECRHDLNEHLSKERQIVVQEK